MQVHHDRSTGTPTAPEAGDELLRSRMAVLGFDVGAVERHFSEAFERLRRNCLSCAHRAPCAVDLRRDPTSLVWEAYCPNSEALNALVAVTEQID